MVMCYSGADGSLQVVMTVDATGIGKTFVAGAVSQNGPAVSIAVSAA